MVTAIKMMSVRIRKLNLYQWLPFSGCSGFIWLPLLYLDVLNAIKSVLNLFYTKYGFIFLQSRCAKSLLPSFLLLRIIDKPQRNRTVILQTVLTDRFHTLKNHQFSTLNLWTHLVFKKSFGKVFCCFQLYLPYFKIFLSFIKNLVRI